MSTTYRILKEDGGVLLKEDGAALLLESAVHIGTDPADYAFGTIGVGATAATGLTHFEVENSSGFPVDVYIKGTDLTGGTTWTLADDGTPDEDIYGLRAGLEGGAYNIIVKKSEPYNKLVSALASEGTQKWGLELKSPTSLTDPTDTTEKGGTITLIGVAS